MSVRGQTYEKQLFTNKAFRHFINIFLNKESGVTKGCELTQNDTTIQIGAGNFCIQGGFLEEDGETELTIPTSAGYHILVYEIDLSKTNTKTEFNQGTYKFVSGVGDYSGLTQEDLDNGGNIYQFEFCRFRITESGLEDFQDTRKFIDYGVFERKDEKGYLHAWLGTRTGFSNGTQPVYLTGSEQLGEYFEIVNGYQIKVLKDCIANVSAQIYTEECESGYVQAILYKNDTKIGSGISGASAYYHSCNISQVTEQLKKDDIISMKINTSIVSGQPYLRSGKDTTFINIEVYKNVV